MPTTGKNNWWHPYFYRTKSCIYFRFKCHEEHLNQQRSAPFKKSYMQEQLKFLDECDNMLKRIYDSRSSNWDQVVADEELTQFWLSDNSKNSKDEILNYLKRIQLLRTIPPTGVQLQDKGKEFCRKEDSLVKQFKEDIALREGEKNLAKLTNLQLKDYTIFKWQAFFAFVISVVSLIIAFFTYVHPTQ